MRLRLRTDRLASILSASRLSQNHWALRLGLSRGHWSDLVNGRHPFPSAKTRQRMLEVFDVDESELFAPDEARDGDVEFQLSLAPRFEILREIGQGAMGSVFLATDRQLGRLVCVKVVSPEAAAGVGSRALLTEIALVARLQHPNILPLFEAGEAAEHPYYVMPYVRDGSLRSLLERRGRLSLDETLELTHGIARGLSHAHEQQVLHCDVKPENILVQDGHCFVMDFGIARKLRSEAQEWRAHRKELDFSAGTPAYVSPEQASGSTDVNARSDVYSLACILFEMLSGHAPFGGRNTQEIVSRRFHEPPPVSLLPSDVPAGVVGAIERAMSLDPGERPSTPIEFFRLLRDAASAPARQRDIEVELGRVTGSMRRRTSSNPRRALVSLPRSFRRALSAYSPTRLQSDVRYAARSLARGWRFALGVVLTLGLGIGLGAPVLSLADHFFLRPPPGVADPDEVVQLIVRSNGANGPYFTDGLTGLDYAVMGERATTLSGVAGWINLRRSLGRGTDARSIPVTLASASYFSVLGVRPFLGRFYHETEDVEGATEAPCVISYRFWETNFEGDRNAIGRTLRIGNVTYTVVGVAPKGFNGLVFGAIDAWLPLRVATPEFQGVDPQLWTTDRSSWLRLIARIAPNATITDATAEAKVLYRTAGERTRDRELTGTYLWDSLEPGRSTIGNRFATISLWLSAGGALLLLLVAANLVNLFVARNAAHGRQTAIRLAIGGGARHLLRLQLVEAGVLGIGAATVGLLIAVPTVRVSRALMFPGVEWVRPAFDARIAAGAFAIAFSIGALVAFWGTAHAMRVDPLSLLRGTGTTQMSGTRGAGAFRRALLVVQAAVFAVLLTGATAFVLSLRRASTVDFGFDVKSVLAARIALPAETPRDLVRELMMRAHERAAALPGVTSASLGYMEPWTNNTEQPISVPGSTVKPPYTLFDFATPEYLRTFGVQMKQGRWIDATDAPNAPPVVVVNETLERVFWPAGGAVGQCMRVGADSMPCRTIVGVVRSFSVTGGADAAPSPVYYIPVAQAGEFRQRPTLFVRADGDQAAVARSLRAMLQSLQSDLPASDVHTIADNIQWFTSPLRLGAAAFTAFGIVAAIVGAVGLYSVLAFLIAEQRRAYAIRLAVGATPASFARSVVRFALVTVLVGMAIGYALLLPLSRVLEPMLYRTRALEPAVVLAVALLGALTAVAAAILPARSVLRTDVMTVLREQ